MRPSLPIRILIFAALLLLIGATFKAQSANDLMATGDVFDRTFQAEDALKCYLPAEKLEPKNVGILMRIARQYRHLMTEADTNEMKLKLGKLSLVYALRGAALAPNDSEAQLSPAITYGKMLPFQGSKEQVAGTPLIKEAVDKALRIDPRNDVAWHVLGRWHQVLASIGTVKRTVGQLIYGKLPMSTNEEAVACFNKALEINPRRLRHYVELGRTYAQMGKNAEAKRFLEKGLSMPNEEHDDPEIKSRGREALAKLP